MVDDFIAAVDAFLPLPKRLVGASGRPIWRAGRDPGSRQLFLPLEIYGEQRGEQLMLLAYPNHPTLKFVLGVKFFEHVVCRLDFDQEAVHGNNCRSWNDDIPTVVRGPHWHKWEINRALIRSTGFPLKLANAVPFNDSRKFDATLRAYCAAREIELGQHAIELPPKDSLI